jgi:hypothetical protein
MYVRIRFNASGLDHPIAHMLHVPSLDASRSLPVAN